MKKLLTKSDIYMNPVVRETADEIFGDKERIHIIKPLNDINFYNFT